MARLISHWAESMAMDAVEPALPGEGNSGVGERAKYLN
jgi:hypothetical protein